MTKLWQNVCVWFVTVCVLGLATGCATDKSVIEQADGAHRELKPAVITDPELAGYLQQVGDRIIASARELSEKGVAPDAHKDAADNNWMFANTRFHLVNSKTLNAFTTGGEHMYIYSELMLACKTEDEMAAVMAHEFAHIYGRHVHNGMNRAYASMGAGLAGGLLGYAAGGDEYATTGAGLFGAAAGFVGAGYGRNDEREADTYGFKFYTRAGWDPNQFSGFFQTLIAQGYDKGSSLTSTHPQLSERVENARRLAAKLPADAAKWRRPPVADPARFAQLKQRLVQVSANVPSDQSLAKARLLLASFSSCVSPEANQPEQVKARELLRPTPPPENQPQK